ncbi:hypothetical protein GQ600_7606 [Phytophthora cactorum]|nr:hypothetical protein GQ600_7606 [Phytophthora cactorum]
MNPVLNPDRHCGVVADSAFPCMREVANTLSSAITFVRQSAEWGMESRRRSTSDWCYRCRKETVTSTPGIYAHGNGNDFMSSTGLDLVESSGRVAGMIKQTKIAVAVLRIMPTYPPLGGSFALPEQYKYSKIFADSFICRDRGRRYEPPHTGTRVPTDAERSALAEQVSRLSREGAVVLCTKATAACVETSHGFATNDTLPP